MIDPKTKDGIVKLVLAYKPVDKIILFDSRANNTQKRASDIDLALVADNWSSSDISEESDSIRIAAAIKSSHLDDLKKLLASSKTL